MFKILECLAFAALVLSVVENPEMPRGVVVETVGPGAAEEAGLLPGDVLLAWRREGHAGLFESPLDALEVETNQAPHGRVTILGERGQAPIEVILPLGKWRLETGLPLDGALLDALHGPAETEGGRAALRQWASRARERGDRQRAAWLIAHLARQEETWEKAEPLFLEAVGIAGDQRTEAWIYELAGEDARRRRLYDDAELLHGEGFRRRSETQNSSLLEARSLGFMARVAWSRRDLGKAEELLERGLAAQRRLAPGSLDVASTLNNLGILRRRHGDLEGSESLLRESLAIKEVLQPDGLGIASSLGNLALVLDLRGDLRAAEELGRRALKIEQRLAPGSAAVSKRLNNLAILARSRGDLLDAEDLLQRSLAIKEKLDPGGLGVAASFNNLGGVALSRFDLDGAEAYFRRSLAIKARLIPISEEMASTLSHLGELESHRRRLDAAEDYFRRALEIREELSPGSVEVAGSLSHLASVAYLRGRLDRAERLYRQALALLHEQARASLDVASALFGLAEVTFAKGDPTSAERLHRESLALRKRWAPASTVEATSLFELGKLLKSMGRKGEALEQFEAAISALELQGERLGGPGDSLAIFRSQFTDLYREAIDLLLELGRKEEAFHVLERSRARGLLEMMAARDLVSSAVPAELEDTRRRLDAEHSRLLAELATWNVGGEKDREAILRARLADLRQLRSDVRSRIRAASPRWAELRYPEALNLAGVQAILDSGTLVLAYSLRRDHGLLFVVGPDTGDFEIHRISIGEAALRDEIEAFRHEAQRSSGRSSPTQIRLLARHLTAALLAPAAASIQRSERLLILPDGVLYRLPFAALLDPSDLSRWFVESKPIVMAASTTVFAGLKESRRSRRSHRLVAFGDPLYPAGPEIVRQPDVASARRSRGSLEPLPASRAEVLAIGELWGEGAELWLGAEATEERVMALPREVSVVHFAVHGYLDDRFPLESALAMTLPSSPAEGEPNGLVQAWEVIERLRIDADLVTLSACETGLGRELAGEGVLGLTRAFQIAGAQKVLASLWRVDDESSAELMQRFYRYAQRGLSSAGALRAAQLDLIRSPLAADGGRRIDARHPFHWAAFELVGDWR